MTGPSAQSNPPPQKSTSVSLVRIIVLFVVLVAALIGFIFIVAKTAPAIGPNGQPATIGNSMASSSAHKNYRLFTATVDARTGWQWVTNEVVKPGDHVIVHASGSWKVAPTHPFVGPEGEVGAKSGIIDWRIDTSANLGQLLVAIAPDHKIIYSTKAEGSFVAPTSGPLEFIINDKDRSNNEGEMKISVEIFEE